MTAAMISGFDHSQRQTIRVGLLKTLRADEFNALSEQMEQVTFAENAVRMAVDTAIQTIGAPADVADHAPAALAIAQASEPLGWGT